MLKYSSIYDQIIAKSKWWIPFINHLFVEKIFLGTLEKERFVKYLEQDAMYLDAYGKAFESLAMISDNLDVKKFAKKSVDSILLSEKEMQKHFVSFNARSESKTKSIATKKYIDFINEKVKKNNWLELFITLAPCSIGYFEVIKSNWKIPNTDNPYIEWIQEYQGESFEKYVNEYINLINDCLAKINQKEISRLIKIFDHTCELEFDFFNQVF